MLVILFHFVKIERNLLLIVEKITVKNLERGDKK
jgi:hypothetical protein